MRAQCLAFAFVGEQLAGVACLKRPLEDYKRVVFKKAQSRAHPSEFNSELGYVSVEPNFQGMGLSSKLADALLKCSSGKVFATSAAGNSRMHATLERFGFRKEGDAYASEGDPKKQLYLFVRAHEVLK
jgi:predicted GNAT family N-acyltransferase